MGHRLTIALIFLNAMGLFACVILIAGNGNHTTYLLVIVSWALFFIAAWRLPSLIIDGLRA